MQKYYICTTGIAKGPFLLEELYEVEVREQDLIWGSKWRKARYANEISEVKKHFREKWAQQQTGNRRNLDFSKNLVLLSAFVAALVIALLYFWAY